MYQYQVRPYTGGRELVANQQPKYQSFSLRNFCGEIPTVYSYLRSSSFKFSKLRSGAVAISVGLVIITLSACGGVSFREPAIKGISGSSATASSLSQISCGTKSLTGAQTKACSVYLSSTASTSTTVALTSSNAALQVPQAVTVAAGAKSAGFDAVSSIVTSAVSVTITGAAGGTKKSDVITVYPPVAGAASLSKVSCGTQTLTGPTTKACSAYLSSAASSPVVVALSSNNSALQVPSSVTVPAGAATGGFTVTVLAVATTQTATLTATANGTSQNDVLQLQGSGAQTSPQYQVQLSWNAPSSTVVISGYRVYRADGGTSTFQLLNSTLDASTSFNDSTVQSGKSYEYQVTSVDSRGTESMPSNPALFTIP